MCKIINSVIRIQTCISWKNKEERRKNKEERRKKEEMKHTVLTSIVQNLNSILHHLIVSFMALRKIFNNVNSIHDNIS